MKAYSKTPSGVVEEILIDLDRNGNPILPPDTTLDPRPQPREGHRVTVIGDKWVQIPVTPPREVTLEELIDNKCDVLRTYRDWLLEQTFFFNDVEFDADDVARARVTQAMLLVELGGPSPDVWIDANNQPYSVENPEELKELAFGIANIFQERFNAATAIRDAILACTSKEELDAIVIPSIGDDMGLNGKSVEEEPELEEPEA